MCSGIYLLLRTKYFSSGTYLLLYCTVHRSKGVYELRNISAPLHMSKGGYDLRNISTADTGVREYMAQEYICCCTHKVF
jgi:hypothetical protein